jgi:hypothetical protein
MGSNNPLSNMLHVASRILQELEKKPSGVLEFGAFVPPLGRMEVAYKMAPPLFPRRPIWHEWK